MNLLKQIFIENYYNSFIKNDINQVIKEELSISNDVAYTCFQIGPKILEDVRQSWDGMTYDKDGKRNVSISKQYKLTIKNKELNINFVINCHDFKDKKSLLTVMGDNCHVDSTSTFRGNTRKCVLIINFNFITIHNKPLNDFYQDLQHEINHLYQQYCDGKPYPSNTKYLNVISHMQTNINNEESIGYKVSRLLYILDINEQDSNVNGMYAYVKNVFNDENNDLTDVNELYKNTKSYEILCEAYDLIDFFKKNNTNEDVLSEIKKYGFNSTDKFIKTIEELLRRFVKKIGRIIVKLKCELYFNENLNIRVNFQSFNENRMNNEPMFYDLYKIV